MERKKKQFYNRILVFILCVIGMLFNVGMVNAAETAIASSDINVDYKKQELTVVLGSNQTIYYGKGTETKQPLIWDETSESHITTTTINNNNVKVAVIDFSFLSSSKDEYIYLKGDIDTQATSVLIKKQQKLKVTFVGLLNATTDSTGAIKAAYDKTEGNVKIYSDFNDETGYFVFSVEGTPYTDFSKIEWRKGLNGTWKSLEQLKLQNYNVNGASLYFRINTGVEQISNEVKVTYQKAANAPAAVIDGANHTIKLTDKMEYRVKVATGDYSDWTTPTFENNKTSGVIKLSALNGVNTSSNGDGVTSQFKDMQIQIRMKASDKKIISKTRTITLSQSTAPTFGTSGIEVKLVNDSDITKGIKVTNNTSIQYQVAVIDKKDQGAYDAVANLDLCAKNKQEGFVTFTNVSAGKSITIPYTKFKAFESSYVVVSRTAMVKENSKTPETEFRLASSIVPVGGDIPKSDTSSGAVMMDTNVESVDKNVKFTVENPDSQIYTSLNGSDFTLNSTGTVSFKANKGSKYVIRAYSENKTSGEKSETVTITLTFVSGGELSDYVNEWGYVLCKMEDAKKNSSSRQIAYQRVFLAYSSYEKTLSVSDLQLGFEEFGNIVQRVRVDNPELLQAQGGLSYTTQNGYVYEVNLNMVAKATAEALRAECEQCLTEVTQKINSTYGDSATNLEKVKVIHDYLILKKQYKSSSMDQTIAGALCANYTPVCMAYSMAFKYLCDANGVQTYVVLGYSGGESNRHAWNNVNMGATVNYATTPTIDNSKWYEMDVTWDDPVGGAEDYIGYSFFNITTQTMEETHTRTYEYYSTYPVDKCTGTIDTYEAITSQSYANGRDGKNTIEKDTLEELMKRCGVEEPTYTKK